MGGRRTVSYTLKPVPVPPQRSAGSTTRVSAVQRLVHAAAEHPGQWFLIAEYQTRTGAYQGRTRQMKKRWPWPVLFHAVPVDREDGVQSELYVKVLEVRDG